MAVAAASLAQQQVGCCCSRRPRTPYTGRERGGQTGVDVCATGACMMYAAVAAAGGVGVCRHVQLKKANALFALREIRHLKSPKTKRWWDTGNGHERGGYET